MSKKGETASFEKALSRIGFDFRHADFIATKQGLASVEDLELTSDEDIDSMINTMLQFTVQGASIFIPIGAVMNLKAMRYWVVTRKRLNLTVDADMFTQELARDQVKIIAENRNRTDALKSWSPLLPDPLTLQSRWPVFLNIFRTYMSFIRGAADCPLTYVFRDHEEITYKMLSAHYETNDDMLIALTPLRGPHFGNDNARVFYTLKPLIKASFRPDDILQFEQDADGRKLILHFNRQFQPKLSGR